MAIKRVILHFGMAKAGSSSIQRTLFKNAAALEKNGFKYLSEWEENHLIKFKYLFSQYPVSPANTGHLGRPLPNKKRHIKKAIDAMVQVMDTPTECETLILSGEYSAELWLDSTIDNIKKFISKYFRSKDIEVTIVYFVRNPLTWIISFLQQRLFKDGFMNKNGDFFESAMKQYDGIINLHKNFSDSLILLKFEDACLSEDGLVGYFLRAIGFSKDRLKDIDVFRENESRCMEVMEFINYVEAVEPRHPCEHYRSVNPNRFTDDFHCVKNIRGVKFDLPYQSKVEFWERFRKTVCRLRENTGIDYTDYEVPPSSAEGETYSEQTIQEFIKVFPDLSFILQKHFLKFFEKKYMETAQTRFKRLHCKGSVPWAIYNSKNKLLSLWSLRIRNKRNNLKKVIGERMPRTIKTALKRVIYGG